MNNNRSKKIMALVLAVLMAVSCIPVQVLASGTTNDTDINLKWDFIVEVNTILVKYFGKVDPTNEEIEKAVLQMDYETYMSAQADIEGAKASFMSLSEEEQESVLDLESVEKLGYMEDTMIKLTSPMLLSGESVTLCDGNVTAAVNSNGTLTESSGTVTVTAKGSLFSKKTANVTITNASSASASVTFNYSVSSYNSFSVDGNSSSASGSYTKQLAAGESMTITIQSKSGMSGTTVTLTLSNFSFATAKDSSSVTFDYNSNLGSVSVDGTAVADGFVTEITKDGATLTATPNSGVTFLGWTDGEGTILSKETSFTYTPFNDGTVKALFDDGSAFFGVGSTYLSNNLSSAVSYAQSSGSTVIYLVNNGTLPAGDYTIPAGITLLIPFDSANTNYTDKPEYLTPSTDNPYVKPVAFRTLTMASGANIVVNGTLSLPAKHVGMSGAQVGKGNSPTGNVSFIKMNTNSNITVNNGGSLYAYGYITGSGNVTANSGATVYEYFQVGDFSGGTNVSKLTDDKKVFLFSQYYIQNIEVPLRIYSGAKEVAVATMDTGFIDKTTTLEFISNSNAMFVLSSGYAEKRYDGNLDCLVVDLYGDVSMSPISFDVATGLTSISIDSADYALPITHSLTINAKSGSNFTISQDISLLPGAEINIEEGAKGSLGTGVSAYIYDVDSWGKYIFAGNNKNVRFLAPPYAPGRVNARTESSLKDAAVCVNGTFDATAGFVFTTSNATGTSTSLTTTGGANIYSTGRGRVLVTPSANVTTYQAENSNEGTITYANVTAEQAKLTNADGSFTSTSTINDSGVDCKVFVYENGTWVHHDFDSTGTCTVCGTKAPALSVKDSINGAIDHSALYAYTVETAKPADVFEVVNGGVMEVVPNEKGYNNATGSKILVEKADGTILKTYTLIVFGDVNGDGTVDGFDAIEIDLAVNNLTTLSGVYAIAADVNADGVVNKTDYDMVCSVASLQSVLENPMATGVATVSFAASQVMPVMTDEACAHNYEEEVIAPTCTQRGYSVFTCTLCGNSYEANVVEATGHTFVIEDEVPATCLATGMTAGTYCAVCNMVNVKQEETPALGHNMVIQEGKPATYSSAGWETYERCSRCGTGDAVTLEKLPTPMIEDFETFLMYLGLLESLAYMYSEVTPETDPAELVIKYIRTGVDRYNSGSWEIMAGKEDAEFAKYVAEIEDGLNLSIPDEPESWLAICSLKNLGMILMPNGEMMDIGHMFGVMDITYHNKGSQNHADVAGWAGDIVDLINDTADGFADGLNQAVPVTGTVEEMTGIISTYYLADPDADCEDGAFDLNDMRADLDGLFFMETVDFANYKADIESMYGDFVIAFMQYYTETLNDVQRAKFYLENRLGTTGTREEIRNKVYLTYTSNKMIATLEGTKEFKVDDISDLRTACCYAFADYVCKLAGDYVENNNNDAFTVFNSEYSTLAPGITQTIRQATTADGKRMVYYLATADINRDDVNVYANYGDNDPSKGWQMQTVKDQMTAAQNNNADIENFNVIAGVNGSGFNMGTGEPSGLLIMDGVVYQDVNNQGFFGIDYDGNAVIGTTEEYNTKYKGKLKEAISGFSGVLIKDGKIVASKDNTTRASRTAVGITATGKVVFMVLDGRQEPISCGGSMYEIAQILYEAGCVQAVNLDGGGSSTYVAKQEGADTFEVTNKPSDGYARSVSTSWYIASTAPSSTAFDHAIIESDYDHATENSTVLFTAKGVSATGNEALLPDGVYWAVDNEKNAVITSEGVLTALKNGETVEVRLMLGSEILASKTIGIVTPTSIYFSRKNANVIYGEGFELPLVARYGNKKISFNADDISFELSSRNAGTVNGFTFVGNEASGVKNVIVTAKLAADNSIVAEMDLILNKLGEATFDFNTATGGNRLLAWNREVSNATTTDNVNYEIIDANKDMETTYAFAIDMTQLQIPDRLQDIVYMLPGAGEEDASAWKFLLQLAERVSAMTTVNTTVNFDKNFDVDYSELKIVSDYFELTGTEFDEETNTLKVTLNWIKQTQAIDPATANPICIVSGAKLTPKETADWGSNNKLDIVTSGQIDYKIFLRANALYTFSSKPENQTVYGLYPFVNPNLESEKGGYFKGVHATFEDKYTLICANNDGWVNVDGGFAYYKGGEKLTGVHKIDGYYYDFGENGVNVGKTKHTGLLYEQDLQAYCYAQNGELVSGWQQIGEDWYHFDSATFTATVGEAELIDGVVYTFEETGKLSTGVWAPTLYGLRYYYGPSYYREGWYNIDGKDYCFENTTRLEEGYRIVSESNTVKVYYFNEDASCDKNYVVPDGFYTNEKGMFYSQGGVPLKYGQTIDGSFYYFNYYGYAQKNGTYSGRLFKDDYKAYTGLVEKDGTLYYYTNGKPYPSGLVCIDGDYYFACGSNGEIAVNQVRYVWQGNGIIPESEREFGPDGKMLNGIVEKDGTLYYYEMGKATAKGLICIDGDYYFVGGSNGELSVNQTRYVWEGNGIIPESTREFGPDGKMLDGIVEKDGTLYYYDMGKARAIGLICIDGDYYFVGGSNGELSVNQTRYVWEGNGIIPESTREFGPDGKMLDGIVEKDGTLYYYDMGKARAIGLICIDGDYYFVGGSNGELAVNKVQYTWQTNDLLPMTNREFGPDGKMLDGIVEKNDTLYYYELGKTGPSGLVCVDGDYYFAHGKNGEVATGKEYVWQGNGILPEGNYEFGTDGKMLDGFITRDGEIYYYKNGKPANMGLHYVDGYYYFVTANGLLKRNGTYYVWETNGLSVGMNYTFDELGRAVI